MNKLVSAIMFCTAATVAAFTTRAQVVGGNGLTGDADFFCSLVHTQNPTLSNPLCGAALINERWVLTAGHCVFNQFTQKQWDSIDVVVAPYIRSTGSYVRVRSQKIYVHNSYDLTGQGNDIALIKLRIPVTSTDPIALPAQGDNSLSGDGDTVHITGFGIHDINNFNSVPDTLQYAQILVIGNSQCNVFYQGAVNAGMLCAGMLTGGPKGGAAGDSGGPLFAKTGSGPVQVGLVSWGAGAFTDTTEPGVYTRISAYRQWIDSVIHADSTLSVNTIAEASAEVRRRENEIVVALEDIATNDLNYALYSYEGRIVRSGRWMPGRREYSIEAVDLQNSLYFISVSDEHGLRFTGKVPVLPQGKECAGNRT